MKYFIIALCATLSLTACKNEQKEDQQNQESVETTKTETQEETSAVDLKVTPIMHASMILGWNEQTIYVDPVGELAWYEGQADADIILITDIHRDHMDAAVLKELIKENTKLIAPQAVADSLAVLSTEITVLNNGDTTSEMGINIEAIPMYNLRDEALRFHPKGRGNGYVLEEDGFRTYISGDTEGTPEMLALENIDVAFVTVNLPYTMSEKDAATAIAQFQPKKVYPYHYRGSIGFSNMDAFQLWLQKQEGGEKVEVVQLDWYPTD